MLREGYEVSLSVYKTARQNYLMSIMIDSESPIITKLPKRVDFLLDGQKLYLNEEKRLNKGAKITELTNSYKVLFNNTRVEQLKEYEGCYRLQYDDDMKEVYIDLNSRNLTEKSNSNNTPKPRTKTNVVFKDKPTNIDRIKSLLSMALQQCDYLSEVQDVEVLKVTLQLIQDRVKEL